MLRQFVTLLQVFFGARPVNSAGVPGRPARTMPRRLRLYIAAVVAAFVCCTVAIAAVERPAPAARPAAIAAAAALLIAMARAYPVRLAPKRRMSVDTAPCFVAVLLLAPTAAILAGALGMLAGEVRAGGRWFQALFNTALSGLRVAAAVVTLRLVAGIPFATTDETPLHPVAMVAAAVVLWLVSSVLVDIAAGLTLGQNPFRGWWDTQRRRLPHESVLLILGVFAAIPARDYPWLLPLLIVPAAVVRRSLHDGFPVRSETRETLDSLAEAMDLRHHRAVDHSRRVAELARSLARRMDLSQRDIDLVTDAARLRDIGESALAPDLLTRTDVLSEEERDESRQHALLGARMVERFAGFAECSALILHHHDRWDGGGEQIPLGARIIAVADTYEAMIASRPYREAFTPAQAHDELHRLAGNQLDPRVVTILLEMLGHGSAGNLSPAIRFTSRVMSGGGVS